MAIETQRYLRKPLYVDAVRITSANFNEVASWCQGEVLRDEVVNEGFTGKKYIKVRVHNPKNPRQTKAFVGDWLLYTERGYKVYTNKAFHTAFDKVEDKKSGSTTTPSEREGQIEANQANMQAEGVLPKYPEPQLVPATPEGIAEAVRENETLREEQA